MASSTLLPVRSLLLAAVLVAAVPGAAAADMTPPTTAPAAPAAPVAPADGLIAPGVTIGGVPVGGLTTSQARAALGAAYQAPVTFTLGKHTFTATAKRLGLHVYVNNPVRLAYAVGRVPTAPTSDIPVVTRVVGSKVNSYLAYLSQTFGRKPIDAKVVLKSEKPFVWKDVWGRTIDKTTAREAIVSALRNPARPAVTLPLKILKPAVLASKLPNAIVIDRGRHSLTLYKGQKVVRRFGVAVGQPIYPTPVGAFHIIIKERYPTWYPPTNDAWAAGLKPVPPGPNNPLGTRWMGIDSPGVGIHGTDAPASIGYSESHGCIRMQVPDAEWVFDHVKVGTRVWIVD
jgi:lipoprotein-anchoring transpeptidase ErfK/SrfK